jgi:ERF superfamily protein
MSEAAVPNTEQPPAPKTLAQKILEIQNAVGVVNKRGKFGSEMGGGNYLRIEDAVVAVNKLMSARGLILTGEVTSVNRVPHEKTGKDGNPARSGYISSVLMRWELQDTDSGETGSWTFPGDGYDSTDKAVYKAMTGCRKYAIINIFNLPIGNDVEEHTASFDEGKDKQRNIAKTKIADAAGRGNKEAIDAMSQVEPERILTITRPEEMNGHYIIAGGFIAVPQLQQFFEDTGSKSIRSKQTGKMGWKVPAEYEKGLVELCRKLEIEVQ